MLYIYSWLHSEGFHRKMVLQKYISKDSSPISMKTLGFSGKMLEASVLEKKGIAELNTDAYVDIDRSEVYFLIMHFLSAGPCQRTCGQLWNELLEHRLLPRRYHAWYSRSGARSGDENDDGFSYPLSYSNLTERYPHVEKDHLVKLLKQLLLNASQPSESCVGRSHPNAADVPTLLGTGAFSLLNHDRDKEDKEIGSPPVYLRWPHMHADQVRGLSLREIGGGFTRHHRAPSIRAACYVIAKPSTMVQKMQNLKKVRGHRNAVYCAIFDRSGRYVITGSDDRLVKIWSMETACCLASCRGHEGDITDLAVSSNNAMAASSSNDFVIRVWHLPDGYPLSVLRGHTGVVTAIAFSPRPSAVYQLLSSSDDGTCRIWDARHSHHAARIYVPKPPNIAGKNGGASATVGQQRHQISCCAFNANGTIFVTGSSDTYARVWSASKLGLEESEQTNHELDVLSGHENDVNYVQFSGCGMPSKPSLFDPSKDDNSRKFRNSWFTQDNIVTCSRDGSAIIWIPKSRRSHGKFGRWVKAYHLKVPPPPMPPQPQRGGPRQRILPTPRGVNMIVWSLDNRFVLAAIMDCRICVWNAITGNLVHSLTGHTESTYVLDVHPFNPRLAMSAGYDGKTIVWDIWEGKPIRIFEIGRFKLVDGKFSPDGMSIILSDDVGQLYILTTGEGESQRDAKYDQFFLGDYRPIIQDTSGNVLDQETQLLAYVRNMQDLLCDSGMIPYPEPYQGTYQKCRLGCLGKQNEWRPLPVELAVGTDFNVGQDYSLFPLPDLDALLDSLPEFVDPLDFGPEIEVQTDDADSEYNVLDESCSGGEEGSLNYLSDEIAPSDDTDLEQCGSERLRRSRRKKLNVDIVSSSGRRVKRRNLDKDGEDSFRNTTKSLNHRRKLSRRKSSRKKSLKPQRAAARKALTLFTRISGTSTEEEEDDFNSDSSESDSFLQNSNIETDASGMEDERCDDVDEKTSLPVGEDIAAPIIYSGPQLNGNKRLILKLSIRDSNKHVSKMNDPNRYAEAGGSSRRDQEEFPEESSDHIISEIPCPSPPDDNCNIDQGIAERDSDNDGSNFNLCERYSDGRRMKWGGVKVRTSKRLKLGGVQSGAYSDSGAFINGIGEDDEGGGCVEPDCSGASSHLQMQDGIDEVHGKVQPSACDDDHDKSARGSQMPLGDEDTSSPYNNGDFICSTNSKEKLCVKRLRIKSSGLQNNWTSSQFNDFCMDDWRKSKCNGMSQSPTSIDRNPLSEPVEDSELRDHHPRIGISSGYGMLDSEGFGAQNGKRYNTVYRRSRSSKAVAHSEWSNLRAEESTSYRSHLHSEPAIQPYNVASRGTCITEYALKEGIPNPTGSSGTEFARGHWLRKGSTSKDRVPANGSDHHTQEMRTATGMQGGLRSTRSRRPNSYFYDTSSPDKRKLHPTSKKLSWLMLSAHEEGSRYIPQKGDDVVYIRQGHQEYLNFIGSAEGGPWRSIIGTIGAVEFCKVETLEYSTVPGSGESCCKMLLRFTDCASNVFNKTIKLTLPEVTGFPDFLVERTRYDAAMERNWTSRDKCQVWWRNEGEDDGSWWQGRVMAVNDKSPEFPDSPWERCVIQYKSDPRETHRHSPWELYDTDTRWEPPRIDDDRKNRLQYCFSKLEKSAQKSQDYYGAQKLKQVSHKANFLNRFPVPLSLEVIHARIENDYYRRMDAVKHDVEVMLANAEYYFEKNEELLEKIGRLGNLFSRTLSSL